MPDSLLPDPTRTAAPPAGSTTRNGEQLTAERTPGSTLSVPPEHLPRPFGRYELRQLLGRGGMGSVYLAHDAQLDRLVALKMPRPFGDDPTLWRERFLTEARAAATLSHPNICPVHDVGEHDGQPYLTMAYIDGETLAARLKRDGRLPVNEAVGLVAVVARAMAEAHARGIVHRDLKPSNLLLDRRGRPVVTDFGLALRASTADDLRLTLTGVAMGTPAYMPPEQAGGDADAVGPASDVYALGVMLFELLTGRVPFRGRTFGQLLAQIERDPPPLPSSLAGGVPPALDAVVLTALAKAPADRFPTAAEFADALEQFQAGHLAELTSRYGAVLAAADETAPHPRPAPTPPKQRTRWWPAVAAGFLGLLVLLGGAIYVTTDKGELKVEFLDPDTGKPIAAPKGIDVKVNGQRVVLDPDGKPITVRAGDDQMLVVTGEDFVAESQTFTLKRWKDATVRVTLIPKERLAKRPEAKPKADGPKADGPKAEVTPDPVAAVKPKPRPVEFPKDKTLVEVGGWQILCDATKEQMQAWLDEKKKAGHSVVWLDAAAVDGKPVFTAVAALDDRAVKWEALVGVQLTQADRVMTERGIDPVTQQYVALSVYKAGDELWMAGLIHPTAVKWFAKPELDRLAIGELAERKKATGQGTRSLRPYPAFGGATYFAIVLERMAAGGGEAFDLSAEGLAGFAADRRKADERVGMISAYPVDGAVKFAATSAANPDKSEWATDTDLTSAALAGAMKDKSKAGFRPESVTAYAWDGAVRYCVVWVKDPPKPVPYPKDKVVVTAGGYETLLDATREQMQAWLDEKKKAKHSVLWLDAIEVDGKPVFSAVAALDDRAANWVAFLDTPAEQFASGEAQKKVGANDHPLAVSGYTDATGTKPVLAILWRQERWPFLFLPDGGLDGVKDAEDKLKRGNGVFRLIRPIAVGKGTVFSGVGYVAIGEKASYLLDATDEQLAEFVKERRRDGERVTSLAMHVKDRRPVYTVVGGSFPDKQRVGWRTDTGLTAAQFNEAVAAQAKAGYRPASVTACPWDGAVRYCVVWVKEPPKPVPFPTDKTLIKEGGYETLLNATKEQMQAWLDEKKKAKHSVLWLDAIDVAGQPLFTAVAALDDRQPDWKAFLGEPAGAAGPVLASKEFQAAVTNHSFVTLSGYMAGEKILGAALLVPGKPNLVAVPNVVRNELNRLDLDASRNGHGYRRFRPYPGFRGETFFAVATEVMTAGGKKEFDLSAEGLDKFAADRRTAGERVGMITAYPADGGIKFAATSAVNPGKADWAYDTGLTAEQFKAKATDKVKLGFRPDAVTAYVWDGAVRYCVVWVKDPPKPVPYPKGPAVVKQDGWAMIVDANKEQVQAWLNERRKDKHSVTWLDVTAVGDQPVYSAVAALDDRQTAWRAFLDEPAVEHDQSSKELREVVKTSSFVALSGYPAGGMTRTAVLLYPKSSVWNALPTVLRDNLDKLSADMARTGHGFRVFRPHAGFQGVTTIAVVTEPMDAAGKRGFDLTPDGLTKFAADTRAAGHRLASVTAYPADGGLKFAAVSAANPGKADWAYDTGLTAAQLIAKAADRSAAGFRPATVTAYAWDGAVRYCVVWVKEPVKPVPFPKDRTLIEAGGWQILCDATQEQMQAWLDEKKTAKHSVTWLDAYPVTSKPLYSAVVALDDREPNWTAMLDLPAKDLLALDLLKDRVNAQLNWPRCVSGFPAGADRRAAVLWLPGKKRYAVGSGISINALKTVLEEAAKLDATPRVVRPYPHSSDTILWANFADQDSAMMSRYETNQPAKELADTTAKMRADDRRPAMIAAVTHNGDTRFSSVWLPNRQKWEWETDPALTAHELADKLKARTTAGMRPEAVTAYTAGGAVRYCVVWVKEPPVKPEPKTDEPKK